MISGADHLHRLSKLHIIIRKNMITENEKYLRQAQQICIDSEPKIRKFKRIVRIKIEELRKRKVRENGKD